MAIESAYQPFEVLTFIAAPALLTNASSLLVLSTSNRFARAVDRARSLEREGRGGAAAELARKRAHMLSWALIAFYLAVSVFALGTFVELLGAGLASIGHTTIGPEITALGIAASAIGILAIAIGAAMLSVEVTNAYAGLREEARALEARP